MVKAKFKIGLPEDGENYTVLYYWYEVQQYYDEIVGEGETSDFTIYEDPEEGWYYIPRNRSVIG